MDALITRTNGKAAPLKAEHVEGISRAAESAHARTTRRNYKEAWGRFAAWCEVEGHVALPASPQVVAAYLVDRATAGLSVASLRLDRAGVRHHHATAGLDSPTANEGVKRVLKGLTRQAARSGHTPRQAAALTLEGVAAIRATASIPRSGPTGRTESPEQARRRGIIDVALASTMLDCLLRRAEAAALTWGDVDFREDGSARVTVRRSKSDPDGEGAVLYAGHAATRALKACREVTGDGGHVFGIRSGCSVARRITAAASAAGLDGRITGHSARIGMARALVAAGESVAAIMVAGRWASARMPAYYARGELAAKGAVARLHGEG